MKKLNLFMISALLISTAPLTAQPLSKAVQSAFDAWANKFTTKANAEAGIKKLLTDLATKDRTFIKKIITDKEPKYRGDVKKINASAVESWVSGKIKYYFNSKKLNFNMSTNLSDYAGEPEAGEPGAGGTGAGGTGKGGTGKGAAEVFVGAGTIAAQMPAAGDDAAALQAKWNARNKDDYNPKGLTEDGIKKAINTLIELYKAMKSTDAAGLDTEIRGVTSFFNVGKKKLANVDDQTTAQNAWNAI